MRNPDSQMQAFNEKAIKITFKKHRASDQYKGDKIQ